jgi:hypothetical protein
MAKRKHSQGRRGPAIDYDSPWKEALDRFFEACLAFFFPQAHADIDWSRRYEMLDKELQQIVRKAKQGRRYVDKLAKVWLKSGEQRWLLIHVEVQVWKEGRLPVFDRQPRHGGQVAVGTDHGGVAHAQGDGGDLKIDLPN